MSLFSTEREAKEFLAGEIVNEAAREGRPLTDIEKKMLYFSESGRTPSNMAKVAETFSQECDAQKYERRIARLARLARRRAGKAGAAEWSEAVKRLEAGDHYLLVMVGQAGRRGSYAMTWRAAIAVILLIVGYGVILPPVLTRFVGHFPRNDETAFFTWAAMIVLVVSYFAIRFVAGRDRVDGWLDRVFEWFERGRRT
jgi:hypothetical protein